MLFIYKVEDWHTVTQIKKNPEISNFTNPKLFRSAEISVTRRVTANKQLFKNGLIAPIYNKSNQSGINTLPWIVSFSCPNLSSDTICYNFSKIIFWLIFSLTLLDVGFSRLWEYGGLHLLHFSIKSPLWESKFE